MTLFTQLGKNNVGTTKEVFNVHDGGSCVMYVKDLFCSTPIVLTQLCEKGHASCTLKTTFVVRALFLPNCVKRVMGTTKEVFNVHDA
jgi:hypothetical protein